MAITCGGYNDLVQAIKDIFPAARPEMEEADDHGFSMFFPSENLGFSLRVHEDRPIALTAFAYEIPFGTNQRVAVMYEIDEEPRSFVSHFRAIYTEIIEQLEYKLWRLNRTTAILLLD